MKLAELSDNQICAYRPRTSDNSAKPAKVVEAKLWRHDEVWNHWDGEPKRTKQTVVSRARKGDRAGRSDHYHATTWAIGVPVLVIEAADYMWLSAEVRVAELPFVIFAKAMSQMNPLKLLEEGYDGRFKGDVRARTSVDVAMSDGTTKPIAVRLELIRPQALIEDWNSYLMAKKTAFEEEAKLKIQMAERKRHNDLMASSIRNMADVLLGPSSDYRGERLDLHRKSTSTGISTTYEVSEEVLLKLLALAERSSSQ